MELAGALMKGMSRGKLCSQGKLGFGNDYDYDFTGCFIFHLGSIVVDL